MEKRRTGVGDATLLLFRIAAGFLFSFHGAQKLLGWFGGVPGSPTGTVELMSRMGFAGVLELGGGILIVLGLLTRPVAFVLAGEMAAAYFLAHFPNGFWPIQNNGELAVLYSFIFLFFAGNGAGRYSLDAMRAQRHEEEITMERAREERPRRAA